MKRRILTLAAVFAVSLTGTASATVVTEHGLTTPGGITAFQKRHHLVVDGVLGHQTAQAALGNYGVAPGPLTASDREAIGLPAVQPTYTAPAAPAATATTVNSSPTYTPTTASTGRSAGGYCGAYQFDDQTWHSVGMSGSACGASPAQQDEAARRLYAQRGSQPWPKCGRYAPNWAAVRQCENSGRY